MKFLLGYNFFIKEVGAGRGLTFAGKGIKTCLGQFFQVGGGERSKFLAGEEDLYIGIIHIHRTLPAGFYIQ